MMKRFSLLILAISALVSCGGIHEPDTPSGKAQLRIEIAGLEGVDTRSLPSEVSLKTFKVDVTHMETGEIQKFDYATIPSIIDVEQGHYVVSAENVTAHESYTLNSGFGCAHFSGATEELEVLAGTYPVMASFRCSMQNAALSIDFNDEALKFFTNCTVKVSNVISEKDEELYPLYGDRCLTYDFSNYSSACGYFLPRKVIRYELTAEYPESAEPLVVSGTRRLEPATHLKLTFNIDNQETEFQRPVITVDDTFIDISEEANFDPTEGMVPMALTTSAATKVAMDESFHLSWESGDRLAAFAKASDGATGTCLLSLNEVDEGLSSAKFRGEMAISSLPEKCVFVHPSSVQFDDNGNAVFSYSGQTGSMQHLLWGSAAYNANGMNCNLSFVGSVLRLSLPEGVDKVDVMGNNGEAVETVIIAPDGSISVGGASSFTVNVNGSCDILMPPVNFTKGFTLVLHKSGELMYKSYSSDGGNSSGYDFLTDRGRIIPVSISSFEKFEADLTIGSNYSYAHQYDASGIIQGTEVKIEGLDMVRSGIPSKIIRYSVELYRPDGTLVRAKEVSASGTYVLDDRNDWPLLPAADNYSLKAFYQIAAGEKVLCDSRTLSIATDPELIVEFSPYSSYTRYLAGDISGANACDNSSVRNLVLTHNLSERIYSLKDKYNISFRFSDQDAAITGNTIVHPLADESGVYVPASWGSFVTGYTFTFLDQVKEKSIDCSVTGLPFTSAPPTSAGWTTGSWNNEFQSDCVQLGGVSGSGECSATYNKSFVVPSSVNVRVSSNATVRAYKPVLGTINTDYTVKLNGTAVITQNSNGNTSGQNYPNLGADAVLSAGETSLKLQSSYTLAGPWVKVYSVKLEYR